MIMSPRLGKTLLAALLLLVGLQEALNMWRQTGSASGVIIAVLVVLALCAWLVRSAYRKRDDQTTPTKGARVWWSVVGVIAGLSILGNLLSLGKAPVRGPVVELNGLNIPLEKCINGSVRMFKEKHERVDYCTCIATRLSEDGLVRELYRRDLEEGSMHKIIEELQGSSTHDLSKLLECFASASGMRWTDDMRDRIEQDCLVQVENDSTATHYDKDKYCDCLIDKLTTHPPAVVATWTPDSVAMITIREECGEMSLK
jgi:hypothetical protein